MPTRRSGAMAFGLVPGWGWRARAAAILGVVPAMIRRPPGSPLKPHGRGLGLMGAGAQASELASIAFGLYGLAPFQIKPKRSDRWPSHAGPPQLRLASKAAVSSSSRRATTTG